MQSRPMQFCLQWLWEASEPTARFVMSDLSFKTPTMKKIVVAAALAAFITPVVQAQNLDVRLSGFSPEARAWIESSCPKALGPSLWNSCIQRESDALRRPLPDLTKVTPQEKAWIAQSCPAALGPRLALTCVTRELDAISAGIPSMKNLTHEQRAWVAQSCPRALGPHLYRACLLRELPAVAGQN